MFSPRPARVPSSRRARISVVLWRLFSALTNFRGCHLAYILLISLAGSVVSYAIEYRRTRVSFFDSLFVGVSASTSTGLVSVDIGKWSTGAMITTLLQMEFGGICLSTCLAVAVLRHRRARFLADRRRKSYESWEESTSDTEAPASTSKSPVPDESFFDPEQSEIPLRSSSRFDDMGPRRPLLSGTSGRTVQQSRSHARTLMGLSIDYDMEASATGWLAVIIALYGLLVQAAAFVALGLYVRHMPGPRRVIESQGQNTWWWALFHTVAAFNNAGMSTMSDGLEKFNEDWVVLCVLTLLIAAGNTCLPIFLRFIVWAARNVSSQRHLPKSRQSLRYILVNPTRCHTHLFPGIHTKLLLGVFFVLTLASTFAYVAFEGSRASSAQTWYFGIFLSVGTRTAGFGVTDMAKLSEPLLLLILGSMYIGSYPIAMVRQYREERLVEALGQQRPATKMETAATYLRSFLFHHMTWLYIFMVLISLFEHHSGDIERTSLLKVAFEIVSAYGTVGYSLGYPGMACSLAGALTMQSRLLLMITMLMGHNALINGGFQVYKAQLEADPKAQRPHFNLRGMYDIDFDTLMQFRVDDRNRMRPIKCDEVAQPAASPVPPYAVPAPAPVQFPMAAAYSAVPAASPAMGGGSAVPLVPTVVAPSFFSSPAPAPAPAPVAVPMNSTGFGVAPAMTAGNYVEFQAASNSAQAASASAGGLPAQPSSMRESVVAAPRPAASVVAVSPTAPLPEGWVAFLDKSTNRTFYYHAASKTKQWTMPTSAGRASPAAGAYHGGQAHAASPPAGAWAPPSPDPMRQHH
eukprot:m51a1_g5545 putative cation transport domain containing protein (803) ;mRNA; r:485928-489516